MGAGIDAINGYNFFMKPVDGVGGIGQNGGKTRRVEGVESVGAGYNPFGAISKIDGEVTPDVGATGSHYTNGIGHGKHTFNLLG
jgi:hypothetical protein